MNGSKCDQLYKMYCITWRFENVGKKSNKSASKTNKTKPKWINNILSVENLKMFFFCKTNAISFIHMLLFFLNFFFILIYIFFLGSHFLTHMWDWKLLFHFWLLYSTHFWIFCFFGGWQLFIIFLASFISGPIH